MLNGLKLNGAELNGVEPNSWKLIGMEPNGWNSEKGEGISSHSYTLPSLFAPLILVCI